MQTVSSAAGQGKIVWPVMSNSKVPGQKTWDLCRAHQEDACTVLAACIQLRSLQVEEFALEHLLQCDGPASPASNMFRARFEHVFGSRSRKKRRILGAHQPYASFLGPCSFQNLILPSIAPSGRLQYSRNTPNKNGGKSSSSMMLFAARHQGRVCSRWFYCHIRSHGARIAVLCATVCKISWSENALLARVQLLETQAIWPRRTAY